MEKNFEILRKCPLFNEVTDDNLIPLLRCLGARKLHFDKKEVIISEGEPAMNIGIMLSGSAQTTRMDYHGNRNIISNVEESDMFAEAFACAGVSYIPVTVIANQDCEILFIDCKKVTRTCEKSCGFHRQIIFNLMKNLAVKNVMIYQKMEITSQRSTREKLMSYLMYQAKEAKSTKFEIAYDRQELADYLQVDRSGLSVEISKLRKEGILRSHKKYFELLIGTY